MNQSIQTQSPNNVSLLISQSRTNTLGNKTGTWRFVQPKYQEKTAPCSNACPLGIDVAKVEMFASRKDYQNALKTILMENPFPAICGRVCFHPCESACNRQFLDQSVGIHYIERFVGNWGIKNNNAFFNYPELNGAKIGIIGAGPAGLSVAYFARCLGYHCDIFEKSDNPGGLLSSGIPSYRLPKQILMKELQRLKYNGIQFKYNQPVSMKQLDDFKHLYDAIFLCCGDAQAISLKISGADHAIDGLHLLHQIRTKESLSLEGTIAVIGGGNTAIDVARSLLRMGARPIIIYRRTRKEMPAHSHEISAALDEGIELKECLSPIAIQKATDHLQVSLQVMKSGEKSKDGRQTYIPDGNRRETLQVNHVVSAIGAEMEMMWRNDQWDLSMSHCQMKKISDMPVFWCGDLTTSEKTVTHALASGKQAVIVLDALKINTDTTDTDTEIKSICHQCQVGTGPAMSFEIYQQGKRKQRKNSEIVNFEQINTAYFPNIPAVQVNKLSQDLCLNSFDEVISGFDESQMIQEASRCFNCGICNDCDTCRIFCPEMAIQWDNDIRHILMDYCKGCGICIVECPRDAMNLEVEP
jgi:NADPH-dependent glutamate synthase beta subunit-like oxidoreductase